MRDYQMHYWRLKKLDFMFMNFLHCSSHRIIRAMIFVFHLFIKYFFNLALKYLHIFEEQLQLTPKLANFTVALNYKLRIFGVAFFKTP